MKKGLRSLIVIALIISIETGGFLFVLPQKAEAVVGVIQCLTGTKVGQAKGKAEVAKAGMSGFGQTVPVLDKAVKAIGKAIGNIGSNISGQTQGSTVTRCIVEPMITIMARSLLNTFTAQTISWINSGFKGSPLYVTNPEGFLTDIADQSLGQFIQGLGPIGQILCSPFDLQLRLSLNLQFNTGGNYYQEIGCRLTDIQQNVQRAFTSGSFGANGWDNWLQLTAQPQNNPYGAFIKASESLSSTIGNRQESSMKQLDWGKGFLSSTDPDTGEVNTPGTLIENQLNKTLAQPLQNVGLAKDIDAILGALVNQLINQVMGGVGGLLGASRRSGAHTASGTYPSADGTYPSHVQSPVERALNSTPGSIIASNEATQTLPEGFFVETGLRATPRLGPTATDADGKPTGPSPVAFCAAFKKNIYSANKAKADDPLTGNTPIVVKIGAAGITDAALLASIPNTPTQKTGTTSQWNLADYNKVATFCQSVNITAPIGDAARDYNEQTKGEELPPEEDPVIQPTNNLALNKPVKQSSTYTGWSYYPEAKIAVDGQTTGNSNYGLSLTQNNVDEWWQVDLGSIQSISAVKIYRAINADYLDYPFYLFITTEDMGNTATTNDLLADRSGKVLLKVPVDPAVAFGNKGSNVASLAANASGRYVRITKYYSKTHLGLSEVEVIPAGGQAGGIVVETPPLSFSINTSEATQLNRRETFSDEVVLIAGKNLSGLKARIKLTSENSYQTQQIPVSFDMFKVTLSLTGGDHVADIVIAQTNCYWCAKTVNPELGTVYGNVVPINKEPFSMRNGESFKINITGTASQYAWGTMKAVLEIVDATGTLLAKYEKVLTLK
ncbi:MAG: discoidin domain-containing protein [bacterium]|nr:discoidin domain-containing protein [bacterium]